MEWMQLQNFSKKTNEIIKDCVAKLCYFMKFPQSKLSHDQTFVEISINNLLKESNSYYVIQHIFAPIILGLIVN